MNKLETNKLTRTIGLWSDELMALYKRIDGDEYLSPTTIRNCIVMVVNRMSTTCRDLTRSPEEESE